MSTCWLVLTLAILAASVTASRGSRATCDDDERLEFNDVPSLTVLSSVVFDGRPAAAAASDHAGDDVDEEYVVIFRVGQLYKGELFAADDEGLDERSRRRPRHVAVRVSSGRCARTLRRRRRRRLLVFLNGSHVDSGDEDRQQPPVYWSTAAPVRFSRRSVNAVRQHSCSDCGACVCVCVCVCV